MFDIEFALASGRFDTESAVAEDGVGLSRWDLRESVHCHLAKHGVEFPKREETKGSEWNSLRRLMSEPMYDFD